MGVTKLIQCAALSCCLVLPFAAQALAQFDDDKVVWPPVAAVPRIHVDTSALAKQKPDATVTAEAPPVENVPPVPKTAAEASPKSKTKIAAKTSAQPKVASAVIRPAAPRSESEAATRVAFEQHQATLKPPVPIVEAVFESRVLSPGGEAPAKPVVVAKIATATMAIAPVVVTDAPIEPNGFTEMPAPHAAVSQSEPPISAAPAPVALAAEPPPVQAPFVQPGPPIVHRAPSEPLPLVAEAMPPAPSMQAAPSYPAYVRPAEASPVPAAASPAPYQPQQRGSWVWYQGAYHWVAPPPGYVAVRYVWRRGQWVPQLQQQGWR